MREPTLSNGHRVGIAFSGGSVRGFAHLGVWEVLYHHGIRPHCVTGASVGSIFAVLVAAGLSPEAIYERARHLSWRRITRPVSPRRLGLVSLEPLAEILEDALGGPKTFADLPIPCALMAFDIEREEPVVLREGPVAQAVLASCAVPGIFTPVRWDGRLLVDGGVVKNMPVRVLYTLGATYTIAIDLLPRGKRPLRPRAPWDVMRIALYNMIRANEELHEADVVIVPDIREYTFVRFSQRDALIARGREAAQAVLPRLLADLGQDAVPA